MADRLDRKPGGSSLVQGLTDIGNSAQLDPGKRTLTEQLPHVDPVVHQAGATPEPSGAHGDPTRAANAVQLRVDDAAKTSAPTHEAAKLGLEGNSQALPYLDQIQRLFGPHDVRGVRAFVGGPAADASRAMGARAYATGNATAFAAPPDLHTAAHEAAHVVQQRAGVQLSGGVGQKDDAYEQHADEVADRR